MLFGAYDPVEEYAISMIYVKAESPDAARNIAAMAMAHCTPIQEPVDPAEWKAIHNRLIVRVAK